MAQNLFLEKDQPVDFLYLDRNRLASLAGQLSDDGVLTGHKRVSASANSKEGATEASIPSVAKATGRLGSQHSQSVEDIYDPFWTHAFSFLATLAEHFAVDLDRATLASVVHFRCGIRFIDLRLLRHAWEPSAHAFLAATSAPVRKHGKVQKPQLPPEQALGLALLKEMPHLLHFFFQSTAGYKFWAAIQQQHLTMSSDDLAMKFGCSIDGLWDVIGIVDAMPPEDQEFTPTSFLEFGMKTMQESRAIVGRPPGHFGITPIAIFSPIKGIAEIEALEARERDAAAKQPE